MSKWNIFKYTGKIYLIGIKNYQKENPYHSIITLEALNIKVKEASINYTAPFRKKEVTAK